MIDGMEAQIAPIDKELRGYARRQAGCQALMAHYGIGPLVAVTILAELVTARGSPPRGSRSATPGWTSPSRSISTRPVTCRAKGRRAALGAVRGRPVRLPAGQSGPRLLPRDGRAARATARACRSRASCSSAATTRCASSERRHSQPHDLPGARQALRHTDRRGRLPASSCPPRSRGRP